jgi:hypothetical protein
MMKICVRSGIECIELIDYLLRMIHPTDSWPIYIHCRLNSIEPRAPKIPKRFNKHNLAITLTILVLTDSSDHAGVRVPHPIPDIDKDRFLQDVIERILLHLLMHETT